MLAAYLHTLNPFVIQFTESFGIRWYGLAYVAGFICGYYLYLNLARRGLSKIKEAEVGDFIAGACIFGVLLGGRLGYYLFYQTSTLWQEPLQVLKIWDGGMSSHGGMLGIFLYTLYYSKRHHIPWANLADNLGVVATVGIFFGRIANFINGELYGRVTDVAWAVQFPTEFYTGEKIKTMLSSPELVQMLMDTLPKRHPSQIYEALLEGLFLFTVLWLVRTRVKTPDGVITGLFLTLYGIVRIFVEQFRQPDVGDPLVDGLSKGQWLSIALMLFGLLTIAFVYFQNRNSKTPAETA